MNILWFIILGVSFVGLGVLVVFLLITIFSERKKGKDNPIILNFLSKRDGGRFIGEVVGSTMGKGGRHLISFSPRDVDLDLERNKDIKNETIIVDRNKLIVAQKGSLSQDKNIMFALPASLADIPEDIKGQDFGKSLIFLIKLKELQKTVEDILREDSSRKNLLLEKIGNGEISKEFINFQEGLIRDYLEKIINPRDLKEKTSTYSSGVGSINPT